MKKCLRCGERCHDNLMHCQICGFSFSQTADPDPSRRVNPDRSVVAVAGEQRQQEPQILSNNIGHAAFVMGLLGVVFSWITFGIPSILAIVLGGIGIAVAGNDSRYSAGTAIVGLVLGAMILFVEIMVRVFVGSLFRW